jgi:hypothetical protein
VPEEQTLSYKKNKKKNKKKKKRSIFQIWLWYTKIFRNKSEEI